MLCDSMPVCLHHFPEIILNTNACYSATMVSQAGLMDAKESTEKASDGRPIVLSTHGLTKDFKKLRAVDSLDLTVRRGDIFGFLGPNGAGKSTTIRLIFGLLYPTSGHVEILGHQIPRDRKEALRHVGGFVDDPTFYGNMTARRNLRLIGGMNGKVSAKRVAEVLEMVGLADRGSSKVGSYSHGMRQRLGIALALIHKPELVILDEPTSGLDPQGMKDVRELIRELGHQGSTVFLSSHLLHEVELVCDQAAILRRGQLVIQGPVSQLRPKHSGVKILTGDQKRAAEVLRRLRPPGGIVQEGAYLVARCPHDMIPEMVRRLVSDQIDVQEVMPAQVQGLEDMFLELTAIQGPEAEIRPS
jgi:ABC-type multidrug transport system ATPase subunit